MKTIPNNTFPIHSILVPSLKVEKRFRPLLVRDMKALMIAQGSEDKTQMIETLKYVLQGACVDDDFNVDTLAVFDCEYLLIKLRGLSISENITVYLDCSDRHNGDNSNRKFAVNVNLKNVEVTNLNNFSNIVRLSDDLALKMKYPTLDVLSSIVETEDDAEQFERNFQLIASMVSEIITKDEVIVVEENFTPEEFLEWLESLPTDQYSKVLDYFDTMPTVQIKVEWDCPICGTHNVRYLSGLTVFF